MDFADSILVQGMLSAVSILILWSVVIVIHSCWISPILAHRKLKRNGFNGPPPSFPLGNIPEIRKMVRDKKIIPLVSDDNHLQSFEITHDIHSIVFPYFSQWSRLYGKVFIYWLGTEPFVYVSDPQFIKQMSSGVMGKSWGKPRVFKDDRKPMFGNHGLLMVEGQDWVHHRYIITPAFSPSNLKAMANVMVDSATTMLDHWSNILDSNNNKHEIDVEKDITKTTAEIIAKTSFGNNIVNDENGRNVFEKLRAMQLALFNSTRLVGVPFSKFIYQKQTREARKLGQEIDEILVSIIRSRKESIGNNNNNDHGQDFLGIMLQDDSKSKKLSVEELVDECKTLFFSGHETTALALTWTLFLLALHPKWQYHLREEIKQVTGEGQLLLDDLTNISKLKKMGWVMNEVLRLYSAAPNVQRQAREDIQVGDLIIPNGTNIWVDLVGMNHDPDLWGNVVNEFKPERFKDDTLHGGCNHKMGYLPFGFGGRMCIGRNLTIMEYKIVLTLLLTRFSFTLSPSYNHSPAIMLSLRPTNGLPLIVQRV